MHADNYDRFLVALCKRTFRTLGILIHRVALHTCSWELKETSDVVPCLSHLPKCQRVPGSSLSASADAMSADHHHHNVRFSSHKPLSSKLDAFQDKQ